MEANSAQLTVEHLHSHTSTQVDLGQLERSAIEFLELYSDAPLIDGGFRSLVGDGGGEIKFSRLLAAAGHPENPAGFFAEVIAQLGAANGEARARVEVGGVRLPYHFLLDVLEQVIPGEQLYDVKSLRRLEKLTNTSVPDDERTALKRVLEQYPVRLSSHVIRQMRLSPDVAFQFMPFADELDPKGLAHTWVGQFHRGVIEQMYRNRVIFILNMSCPVYCRFCFRKHKECRTQRAPTQTHVDLGVAYIRECPDIKEIVLTGGDPFMNRPTLTRAVDRLGSIPHVETLRLATRSLSFHPALFAAHDGFWLNYLRRKQIELQQKGKRIEVATHFIHPDEVSLQSLDAISELVGNGVPVYVQTPFLGGCNDSAEVMAELFSRLRAVGAQMHYVFMPCSPIQGNARYRSTIARGLEVASQLRARLSDRALPNFCTATAIGKIDWGTSGWVVESDPVDPDFLWLRTPYTVEFFESFAPILDLSEVARPNSEGTLDARFMVEVGDPRCRLGSREARGLSRSYLSREGFPQPEAEARLAELQRLAAREPQRPRSIVDTGSATLFRTHVARVELDCDADGGHMDSNIEYIRDDRRVTDVVLFSGRDPLLSPQRVGAVVEQLTAIRHVTAVRLRSQRLVSEPESVSDGLLKRVASWNRLTVVNPLRLEIEILLLHASELQPQHTRIVRTLLRRGVTVYSSTPLLAFINDDGAHVAELTAACRRLGIEMHQLVIAGSPIQREWSERHPIQLSQVVDLASHLRRTASGRELPKYIVMTELGEVDLGLSAELVTTDDQNRTWFRLLAYDLEYYRRLQPDFELPDETTVDDEGHPVVAVHGLVA
jgi:KamA family protein